ncbi:50S ribosomal protein L25/general stress protein Ctc [methanotrophic endosymbiont of Bathymodiolus puteoserpentis (Logatchev)]|jgi:large subunit ribosomal protein L25|uniref:50S ribosomal protein L25/general stress protein Ctc n=1 Tax=methanotrophic endosymbiont of Bathymodiolus puteoserpentis (Logatchev) TaxID=343235 RepID=UPI0013C5B9E0|nr:50S ribosomal protein L25/general stress protein Ctc [methanotrophic endosymbiont of Bathymodiolus puteoserpentis (Logatchev)]SHE21222.1 LSU ribosomal protein L25p [methanotrophic endosymbiont of Bathymodiolus puteoserpentis (Logatchev)]
MSNVFEFNAVSRVAAGTGSAKASRRNGNIPAVIYGGNSEPELIELNHNAVVKSLANEAVYSHILKLNVGGKIENAILKDMQRHPAKTQILHMDFMRVVMSEKLKLNVPLHFINEELSPGVKEGGVVMHSMTEVEIECLPGNIPEYIEVDLTGLQIGESIHLSQLVLVDGLEIIALTHGEDHDLPVAQVMKSKGATDEDAAAAEGDDGAATEEEVASE